MKQPVNKNGIEGYDYIQCKICGEKFNQLNHKHIKTHKLTSQEYKEKYNIKRLTAISYSKKREQTFLNKYGVKNQFGRNDVTIDRKKQIENTKNAIQEKYCVDNVSKLDFIKEKKKNTFNKKYGYKCNMAYDNKQKMIKKYSEKLGTNDLELINEYRLVERKLHTNFSWYLNKLGKTDKTFNIIPYTKEELINRLKSTMPKGYTWEDYLSGKLEIDHIIPKSLYIISKIGDEEFNKCWNIRNLRLLPEKENASKKDKLIWMLVKQYQIKDLLPITLLFDVSWS